MDIKPYMHQLAGHAFFRSLIQVPRKPEFNPVLYRLPPGKLLSHRRYVCAPTPQPKIHDISARFNLTVKRIQIALVLPNSFFEMDAPSCN